MEARDPVPSVAIPVTVGKRTIMVQLSTPEECDALVLRVSLAKSMIIAAQMVLVVDAEIVDADDEDDAWRLTPAGIAVLDDETAPEPVPWPIGLCGHTVTPAAWSQGHTVCRECQPGQPVTGRELCTLHGGSDGQLTKGCELCAEELTILGSGDAEPEPGTQAYAGKYASAVIGRALDLKPEPPVTYLACGDQLHDQAAALLAVGAIGWCPVHGNTEVISTDEHTATAPDHDYVTPGMAARRDSAAEAYESAVTRTLSLVPPAVTQ